MSAFLSPIGNSGIPFFNSQGVILAGGMIYTYQAGTTTPVATWTTSAQSVQNSNPIVLNAAGLPPQQVWLLQGTAYKFVIQDSSGNTLQTLDNVSGINDATLSPSPTEWVNPNLTPTYISANQFSLPGNQTFVFLSGRRIKATVSAGTVYGYISTAALSAVTTVSVVLDSGNLDSGLSSVSYALLSSSGPSLPSASGSPLMIGGATSMTGIATGSIAANTSAIGFNGGGDFLAICNATNAAGLYLSKPSGALNLQFIDFYSTGSNVGSISTNGTTTAYNTSSDYRLKENIVPLIGALPRLLQAQARRYNFKSDTSLTLDGFIAHELASVVPEAVHGSKDEVDADGNPVYQQVDYAKIMPLVVAAIQELSEEVNQIKAKSV